MRSELPVLEKRVNKGRDSESLREHEQHASGVEQLSDLFDAYYTAATVLVNGMILGSLRGAVPISVSTEFCIVNKIKDPGQHLSAPDDRLAHPG